MRGGVNIRQASGTRPSAVLGEDPGGGRPLPVAGVSRPKNFLKLKQIKTNQQTPTVLFG